MDGCLFRALIILSMLPGLAKADAVNSEWYSTTRIRSMGNIGIASGDDPSSAAFYNPASLSHLKKNSLELFNPQIDLGSGFFSLSNSIVDWGKQTSFNSTRPLVYSHPGTPSSIGYSFFPNVSGQNFSFGVLYSNQMDSYYKSSVDTYYHHSRELLIPTLGISAALMGGRVRFGLAVRAIQDSERNKVVLGTSNPQVNATDYQRAGLGFGFDGGMLLTLPWAGLPTLGLVARNIGDTTFISGPMVKTGPSTPNLHESIRMTYDGGFSFITKAGKGNQTVFAIDYRDILNTSSTNILRKINTGLEFGISKMLFFRIGYSQAAITGGFGLSSKLGSIDFGTSSEEIEPTSLRSISDRRFSFMYTRRF